jgi:hypothetical protein
MLIGTARIGAEDKLGETVMAMSSMKIRHQEAWLGVGQGQRLGHEEST